jgi:hypothetical protein
MKQNEIIALATIIAEAMAAMLYQMEKEQIEQQQLIMKGDKNNEKN